MGRQTPADSRSMIRFIIVSETRYQEGWYKGCSASLARNEIRRDPNSKFVLRLLDSSMPAARVSPFPRRDSRKSMDL